MSTRQRQILGVIERHTRLRLLLDTSMVTPRLPVSYLHRLAESGLPADVVPRVTDPLRQLGEALERNEFSGTLCSERGGHDWYEGSATAAEGLPLRQRNHGDGRPLHGSATALVYRSAVLKATCAAKVPRRSTSMRTSSPGSSGGGS